MGALGQKAANSQTPPGLVGSRTLTPSMHLVIGLSGIGEQYEAIVCSSVLGMCHVNYRWASQWRTNGDSQRTYSIFVEYARAGRYAGNQCARQQRNRGRV